MNHATAAGELSRLGYRQTDAVEVGREVWRDAAGGRAVLGRLRADEWAVIFFPPSPADDADPVTGEFLASLGAEYSDPPGTHFFEVGSPDDLRLHCWQSLWWLTDRHGEKIFLPRSPPAATSAGSWRRSASRPRRPPHDPADAARPAVPGRARVVRAGLCGHGPRAVGLALVPRVTGGES